MPNNSREKKLEAFGRLLDILDELRVKCPWDRKQTNESLRPNTIEETMELADAIMGEDDDKIRKELGDVLLHIVFYAKIGDEKGKFDIADVCDALCEKLIFRHPHVFGDEKADTAAQVLKNWELIKMSEKDGNKMVLSGVPRSLPSLIKAERVQEKAANVGFDWQKKESLVIYSSRSSMRHDYMACAPIMPWREPTANSSPASTTLSRKPMSKAAMSMS